MTNRIVLAFLQPVAFDIVADSVEDFAKGSEVQEAFRFTTKDIETAKNDRGVISEWYESMKSKGSFVTSEIESKRRWLMWLIDSDKLEDLGW